MSAIQQPVVFLCRHGQTTLNAEGRLRGLSDPPLDDVGRREVRRLAVVIAEKQPTVVISSPLRRAVATAEAIAAAAHVQVVVDVRLNDRDYGPHTGQPRGDVVRTFGSVDAAPGVEPLDAVAARAREGFRTLVEESGPGPLVFVSHDAIIAALLADFNPDLRGVTQRTASWNELYCVNGAWHVEQYDQKPES